MKDADQLIAEALRDIAAEAGLPGPMADSAWRAGRRRRMVALAASAASVAGVVAIALSVALPQTAPGPAASSGRIVSITLSPVTPASTGTLADAVRLISQRAAYLRLPDTRAQVSGPDIVLTGPAADEAQLKAIAAPGVLSLRQVLLSQEIPGKAAAGDPSLVNKPVLTLFRNQICTPGNSNTWQDQVGYTVARDYDNPGAQVVSCDRSGGKYALAAASVLGTQIRGATIWLLPASGDWTVRLVLDRAGTSALGSLTTRLYNMYYSPAPASQNNFALDSFAFDLDGSVVAAPEIQAPMTAGVAQITGISSRVEAQDLAAILLSGPLPVGFRIG